MIPRTAVAPMDTRGPLGDTGDDAARPRPSLARTLATSR